MQPPFTYEGLLVLIICLYALYSTSYNGYSTRTHLFVLCQALIHNIVLSPLLDNKKSALARFQRLRENPLQIEHRGGVLFCGSLVPLLFATMYARNISNTFVFNAWLASVWCSALLLGALRGTRGVIVALVECALAAYWTLDPLTTPLTTLLLALFIAYWLYESVPRSVTWGEIVVLAQLGGTLITWLLPWHNHTFESCTVVTDQPFTERSLTTMMSSIFGNLLLTGHYPLSLNETLFDHVLSALVNVVLRYGLSHVLLSLSVTWWLARHVSRSHSRTFIVVSIISLLGHLLLIIRTLFMTPVTVIQVTGVKQTSSPSPSPLMALLALFLYWAILLLLCLWLVSRASVTDRSRVTRVRKWYHVLSLLMFWPPLLLTTSHVLSISHVLVIHALLLVAYPLVLGLGALVEYLRVHHLLFGDSISAQFEPLLTDIDRAGPIVYSHLALIGGLLGPVTLSHVITGSLQLSLVSVSVTARALTAGLHVLDVADTAASWFGSKYGRVRWSHVLSTRALCAPLSPSRKSIEGSFAALVALVSVDHVMCALVGGAFDHVLVSAVLVVFTEAITTQIDNLVLPLLYWSLLLAASP